MSFFIKSIALKVLEQNSVDPDDIGQLLSLLKLETGTTLLDAALNLLLFRVPPEALDSLKKLLSHPDNAIRTGSLHLIAELQGAKALPLYEMVFKDPKNRRGCDAEALSYLIDFGDETTVPLIARWVEKKTVNDQSSQRGEDNGQSDRVKALAFLHRYPEREETREAFAKVLQNWKFYHDSEAAWLTDQLEYFNRDELRRPNLGKPPFLVPVPANLPVFEACKNGEVEVVRAYLDQGGSVYSAPYMGRSEMVPNLKSTGSPLALIAVAAGQLEILKLLHERGLDINRPPSNFGYRLLDLAYGKKWENIVDYLLEQGADCNLTNLVNYSFFYEICQNGEDLKLIQKLIEHGADINDHRHHETTPLMEAAKRGNIAVMELLFQAGADLEKRDEGRATALILAIEKKRLEAVVWLLDHGANIEASGYKKQTPVMFAMEWARGETAILKVLLDRGVNLQAKDNLKRTVATLAKEFHSAAVWGLVQEYLPVKE